MSIHRDCGDRCTNSTRFTARKRNIDAVLGYATQRARSGHSGGSAVRLSGPDGVGSSLSWWWVFCREGGLFLCSTTERGVKLALFTRFSRQTPHCRYTVRKPAGRRLSVTLYTTHPLVTRFPATCFYFAVTNGFSIRLVTAFLLIAVSVSVRRAKLAN